MNKELKEIIDNAKNSTLKHDGYDKLIVQDQDGHYSFSRKYDDYFLFDGEKIVGEVISYWEDGCLKARYKSKEN